MTGATHRVPHAAILQHVMQAVGGWWPELDLWYTYVNSEDSHEISHHATSPGASTGSPTAVLCTLVRRLPPPASHAATWLRTHVLSPYRVPRNRARLLAVEAGRVSVHTQRSSRAPGLGAGPDRRVVKA